MSEAAVPSGLGRGSGITRVLSDDRLAQRAAKGDERAFAAIFDRYHQSLYRYCLAIVGNPEDAQDALQNTMIKVLRGLPGEERRIQLKPWLYRIAHNESIELIRRRRETRQLDPELAAAGSGLAEEAASREQLRRLISDLDELPERQRGTLVMRELAGLDFAAIGAALGASPAAARQTLYEARLSLRQMDRGREMICEVVTKALSNGDGRVIRRRELRAHLRACPSCRSFREEIEGRERDLAALPPLPAVAAAGLLQGLLGDHGAAGGGLATALGGGVAKSLGTSAALKGAATVAVVAAIGVGAANPGGLIDVGLPGGGGSRATRAEQPEGARSAGAQRTHSDSAAVETTASSAAVARGVSHLGASQTAKPGAARVAAPGGAKRNAEAAPAPTSQSTSAAHPRGREHETQLPSASAHGQQMAASHKPADRGHPGPQGPPAHPAQPAQPAQPANPSNPSAEEGSSSPPSGPETRTHGNAAIQGAGGEEAPPEHESGKKP